MTLAQAHERAASMSGEELHRAACEATAAFRGILAAMDLAADVLAGQTAALARLRAAADEQRHVADYLHTVHVQQLRAFVDSLPAHIHALAAAGVGPLSQPAIAEIQYTPLEATSGVRVV